MFEEESIHYIRKRSAASIEISRIILVVMDFVTAGLSLITVISFGYVLKFLHWECPLYSKLEVDFIPTKLSNDTVVVHQSKWGKNEQCWFPLSISVLSAMGNFIWAWLLLHFKMRIFQEGIYHSYVFMSMMFEVILFIFSFASSLVITTGQRVWCENMLKGTSCTCKQILSFPWEIVGTQRNMYLYMQTAKISSWLTTASLLMVTLFALIRFYGGPIFHVCSRDKGEQYVPSPDAEKNGLPYSALSSVNSRLGFENTCHSINDDHIVCASSPDIYTQTHTSTCSRKNPHSHRNLCE